ncbi:MAG: twin-arginine translocase TatA/TatE family subunit [Microthrixaceae bacterium]
MNEWVWVILIAAVVLGGSQIPKLARNLGRAQNEFKRGLDEGKADVDDGSTSDS